jgi:uncharacterized membrane protein
MAKLCVGMVRGSGHAVRRALIAIGGGYVLLGITGAVVYWLLHGSGMAYPQSLAESEGVKTVVDPTAADWLISGCGATAGVVIASAYRHAVIAGAQIALALVPAAALVGAGLTAGELLITLEALRRVAIDAALVVGLGAVVLTLKQRLVHRNRPP